MKQTTLKSLNSGLQWKSIRQLLEGTQLLWVSRDKTLLWVSLPTASCKGVGVAITVKSGHRAKLWGKICIFSACHSWLKPLEAAGGATTSPGAGALTARLCFQEVLSAEGFHFTSSQITATPCLSPVKFRHRGWNCALSSPEFKSRFFPSVI